jgi:hypothetical protein
VVNPARYFSKPQRLTGVLEGFTPLELVFDLPPVAVPVEKHLANH